MSTTGIIVPGPELRRKIDQAAVKIAEKPALVQKVLASAARDEFAFLLESNEFNPYFVDRLHHAKAAMAATAASASAASGTTGAPAVPAPDQQKAPVGATQIPAAPGAFTGAASAAAGDDSTQQQDLRDPLPDRFDLPLRAANASVPQMEMDIISLAAQHAAALGPAFVKKVLAEHGRSRLYDFLIDDHPRHQLFVALRDAYAAIIEFPPAVEQELEADAAGNTKHMLGICEAKARCTRAAVKRKQCEALSESDVMQRLLWSEFTVLSRFSKLDLGLDESNGYALPSQPSAAAVTASAQHIAALTAGGGGGQASASVVPGLRIVEQFAPGRPLGPDTTARRGAAMVVVDQATGEAVNAESAADYFKTIHGAAGAGRDERLKAEKRQREIQGALADDDEVARNTRRQFEALEGGGGGMAAPATVPRSFDVR